MKMELRLYAALVARLQIRTITSTLALSSLNYLYLVAYLSSYHEKAINALSELA